MPLPRRHFDTDFSLEPTTTDGFIPIDVVRRLPEGWTMAGGSCCLPGWRWSRIVAALRG